MHMKNFRPRITLFLFLLFSSLGSEEEKEQISGLDCPPQLAEPLTEEGDPATVITLNDAVVFTLENEKDIQIAIFNIKQQQGVLQASAGPFDLQTNQRVFEARSHNTEGAPPIFHFSTRSIQYEANATKTTRLGTAFSLTAFHRVYSCNNSRSSEIVFEVDQPLLRNFVYGINRQTEEANRILLQAVRFDTLFTISTRILDTVNSYWDAVAAQESFTVLTESVKRLEKLAQEVEDLVKGGQLAGNDTNQPQATLATEKQRAYLAENTVYTTKQLLLLNMGIINKNQRSHFEKIIRLGTRYPEDLNIQRSISTYADYLIRQAFSMRFDILASKVREDANEALLIGTQNETLPDLSVFGSYTRHNTNVRGLCAPCNSSDFAILGARNLCRDNEYRVGLSLSVPFFNDRALGNLREQQAVYQQSLVKTELLQENTTANILNILHTLALLEDEMIEAQNAADLYKTLYDNEGKKLIGGFGSLFEMLSYETSWTDALLSLISLKQSYFQNIANLRFNTGTLVILNDCSGSLSFEDVTTLPLLLDDDLEEEKKDCKETK